MSITVTKPILEKPIIYASVDEWGHILNKDLDALDIFNRDLLRELDKIDTSLRDLEANKVDKSEVDTIIGEKVDNYIDINVKPDLDKYVNEKKKPELDKWTLDKKAELDTYVETVSKISIDNHTNDKKLDLDNYVAQKKIELNDHTTEKKAELDAHEKIKEGEITSFTDGKKVEITTHTDEEIERIKGTGIDSKLDKGGYTGTAKDLSDKISDIYETNIIAGNGLSGGGDIKHDVTLDIVSEDEGIIVNADSIRLNIVNDLVTGGIKRALSAEQGKVIKQLIDAIGTGGFARMLKNSRALGSMDYIGILPENTKVIVVGSQLYAPKLYLDGIMVDKNMYTVDLVTGMITLNEPYSFYEVVYVVEDSYPYHIKFSFPTLSILLSTQPILDSIEFDDVIEILGEYDADDGDHRLVKCENIKKLNGVEIATGKYLNEIPNTRISDKLDKNGNAMVFKNIIKTSQQFNEIDFTKSGMYYIENFNTIFTNNGIKPQPSNTGLLQVYSNEIGNAIAIYRQVPSDNPSLKMNITISSGVVTKGNWTYENVNMISNNGNIILYGTGDKTNNQIIFSDYNSGTATCSIFDGTKHSDYNGIVVRNDKVNTNLILTNDRKLSFVLNGAPMPVMLNERLGQSDYTYIHGSGETINKSRDKGLTLDYVDGVNGMPTGMPDGWNYAVLENISLASGTQYAQKITNLTTGDIKTRVSLGNPSTPQEWATLFSTINTPAVNLGGGNGYMVMPNGLIIQFGRVQLKPDANAYSYTGNYHIPFKSFSNVYVSRSYSNHSPASLFMVCWEKGVTQFQIHISTSQLNTTDMYYWFAIGI